ncbi:ran GTPase-activating protein 1-like, partial [Nilaparvata lugens]|uniref:ran GTPase-activating protein 1-like n=1 Tax=Nilaparvata lugens TaxID=108931 RepID=UPI00193E7C9D
FLLIFCQQEVNVSCNEIRLNGGLALAEALLSKTELTNVILDGNQFGEDGVTEVHERLSSCTSATISIEDDEGDEDDDDDEEEEEEEDEEEEEEEEENGSEAEANQSNKSVTEQVNVQKSNATLIKPFSPSNATQVTVSDFLKTPTVHNFLSLGTRRNSLILDEVKKTPESDLLEAMLSAIMKVSALVGAGNGSEVDKAALTCSDHLYQHLCNWSKTNNDFSLVSNTLLVHLGLMKSEDKSFKITYNTHGCRAALQQAMTQNYFPTQVKETMQFFLNKK